MHSTEHSADYISLSELLGRSGSPLQLAELHGGLSGVICAGGRDAGASWLGSVLDDCANGAESLGELASALESLGDATWQGLSGLALEFTPLLPDEDALVELRAEALALWCHGFLSGLVIGGLDLVGGRQDLSEEVSELVRDFAEISKAGAEAAEIEDPETGDSALTELIEFVRIGVQYIFEELMAQSGSAAERTIH